ncbi:hypothetical protein LCGC14_0498680 [marine sediment metagenome]|uniref:Uncharacterized protein n=1 Tax=marine sediment metagenome TaxID=412755 RepID=A0A0F9S9U1_9ZZZZ
MAVATDIMTQEEITDQTAKAEALMKCIGETLEDSQGRGVRQGMRVRGLSGFDWGCIADWSAQLRHIAVQLRNEYTRR